MNLIASIMSYIVFTAHAVVAKNQTLYDLLKNKK